MAYDFWSNFNTLCRLVRKTPNKVCLDIGLSRSACSHWSKGNLPKPEALIKIADYFDVSTDYLLGRIVPDNQLLSQFITGRTMNIIQELLTLNKRLDEGDARIIEAVLYKYRIFTYFKRGSWTPQNNYIYREYIDI